MMRLTAPLAVVAALIGTALTGAPRHRLHRPPPALPTSLSVDLQEYSVTPSHRVLAAGTVTFSVYNRGMDEHNLTIRGPGTSPTGAGRVRGAIWLQPGTSGRLVAKLKPGKYLLYCSMFMGTPQSHYALGMHALVAVR
jgi:uncharacterized cupredoxin-like copper-binding protein